MGPEETVSRGKEFSPPPDEFNRGRIGSGGSGGNSGRSEENDGVNSVDVSLSESGGSSRKKERDRKRKQRQLVRLVAAAATSVAVIVTLPPEAPHDIKPVATVEPTASPAPTPWGTPEPAATPETAPTPTPTPAATPEAVPAPTPGPSPTPALSPTPTPAPRATPAPSPTPSPAPAQTPAPSPTPSPTPIPTPEPTPGYTEPTVQVYYIGFSSAKLGKIVINDPESVTSVTAEIREPILDKAVASYELTAEEIASGVFELPTIDAGDVYFEYLDEYDAVGEWPEYLELHVTVRYLDAAGEEQILEFRQEDEPEQGWSVTSWDRDEEPSEWSYPGYFRFSTYESDIPLKLVLNDPDAVTSSDVFSITLSIDGRTITADECEISEYSETPYYFSEYFADFFDEDEMPVFYYARLMMKIPDWAPETGTIHVKVVQMLFSDGSIWTTETDCDYS